MTGASDARVTVTGEAGNRVLQLAGRLDARGAGTVWRPALAAARREQGRPVSIDLSGVTFCDMAGATFLVFLQETHGGPVAFRGTAERVEALLQRARIARAAKAPPATPAGPSLGEMVKSINASIVGGIGFIGEVALACLRLPWRWRMIRMKELLAHAEQAGTRSLPLIILLGYLMGLILAFQSAIPMRRFGAEVFVANLVSISLLRELGPLLAAVILAGRTASAFAAEIGTMKVNEEIDALSTMGLDPVTMLVLPRLAAAILVMPVMTLVLDIAGLIGMATVMQALGFPLVTITRQIQMAAKAGDLLGGLFKAVCFGAAVAAIGCRAGLATGVGPRAVGLAATAAVVGGIVATIILDGMFALMFYRLGL